jgi:DNA-binding transcriptional LysR family regulator
VFFILFIKPDRAQTLNYYPLLVFNVRVDIKQLKYFIAICHYKNFSRAAEECYISPQGISLSMQRLEEEIGRKLFERTTREVKITPDGEYLLPRVKQMLEILGSCEDFFNRSADDEISIRIPFVIGSLEEYAGQVIGEFIEQFIGIDAPVLYDYQCEDEILNGRAELAVSVGPVDPMKFDSTWLYTTKNILVAHKNHPLANKKTIEAQDLKSVPLVALNSRMRSFRTLMSACEKEGFSPTVKGFVESVMLVYYVVETNKAVGLTTLGLFERTNWPNIRHIPFKDPAFDREIYAISRMGAEIGAYHEEFRKMLVEYCNSRSLE